MRFYVRSIHRSTFYHFGLQTIYRHIFILKFAIFQITKVVTVLQLQHTIKIPIGSIHYLYRTPHLTNGVVTAFLLMMRPHNPICSIVAYIIDKTVHIHTLHSLIGQHPKETTRTTGMTAHHFPIIVQPRTMAAIVESMQELGRHKDFGQAHIVLTFSIRTIMHGFVTSEIALRMNNGTLLYVMFVELTIKFGIPPLFITVTPPNNGRMVMVALNHLPPASDQQQSHACHAIHSTHPLHKVRGCRMLQRIRDRQDSGSNGLHSYSYS